MSFYRMASALCLPIAALAQNYTAERAFKDGVAIVRLRDAERGVEVSVVPSVGNQAFEMKVHGKNILFFAFTDLGEFKQRPTMGGIPFLAPWADLLNKPGFWANGKYYRFNMELGNVRG